MLLSIGIIGCGIVGGSLKQWIQTHTDHQVIIYDPAKGYLDADALKGCQVVFICVPVPTKSLKLDTQALEEALTLCPKESIVFVRSTVLPGTCDRLGRAYARTVCAMPEFLTESRAYADMEALDVIVGHPFDASKNEVEVIAEAIFNPPRERTLLGSTPSDRPYRREKRILVMRNQEAELAKYVHNCYGAMKVTFFNGIFQVCSELEIDYQQVLAGARMTGFIEKEHTRVPGPDGKRGFGGKCFPKDLTAFIGWLGKNPFVSLFNDVFCLNRFYRGEKDFDDGTGVESPADQAAKGDREWALYDQLPGNEA